MFLGSQSVTAQRVSGRYQMRHSLDLTSVQLTRLGYLLSNTSLGKLPYNACLPWATSDLKTEIKTTMNNCKNNMLS